jgi:hypothetical protein
MAEVDALRGALAAAEPRTALVVWRPDVRR